MATPVDRGVSQAANAFMKQNHRTVQKLPDMLVKNSKEQQVWLYSVGPWPLARELGSIGTFRIPACPDDKEYVAAAPIPGIFTEPVIVNETTMELRMEPGGGQYIAQQVLGVGMFIPKRDSFAPMGVFIGSQVGPNAKPTKEELAEARQTLNEYFAFLVNEARTAYQNNDQKAITDRHRLAARRLKLENEVWYAARTATARQSCPACGTTCDNGIVLCPNCKFILDAARYEKLKAGFAK